MNMEHLSNLRELASTTESALGCLRLLILAISEKVKRNEDGYQRFESDINRNLSYINERTSSLYSRYQTCKDALKRFTIDDTTMSTYGVFEELDSVTKETISLMASINTFDNSIKELLNI